MQSGDAAAANLPLLSLAHFQLCSSSRDGVQALWWSLSERSFNGDKTSASQQLTGLLSLSLSLAVRCPAPSPSSHPGVSLALLLAELACGVYTSAGLRTVATALLRVCVCVVVCQVLCACVGWSVVSLLAMRHSSRHTRTHRGGGCCVRGEGAVGDLCELDLGFLVFTSQSGCYSIVDTRSIGEGVDQKWKRHYGSYAACSLPEHAQCSLFVF